MAEKRQIAQVDGAPPLGLIIPERLLLVIFRVESNSIERQQMALLRQK